jgi:hypothetical protein
MRLKYLIVGIFFLTNSAFSQVGYYRIDGSQIKDTLSINDVCSKYYGLAVGQHASYDVYLDDPLESKATGISMIVYEKLSGRPLYAVTDKVPTTVSIAKIAYRYSNTYHQSFRFFDDISKAVDDHNLTKSFISKTLGTPSTKTEIE